MRGRALRLQEHEDSTTPQGLPKAEAYKAQPFKVEKFTDWAARAVEVERRRDRAEAEAAAKKEGKDLPPEWGDGVHYFATLPDPSELREDPRGH